MLRRKILRLDQAIIWSLLMMRCNISKVKSAAAAVAC
jgi:hypothetical protein